MSLVRTGAAALELHSSGLELLVGAELAGSSWPSEGNSGEVGELALLLWVEGREVDAGGADDEEVYPARSP